ncbi:MAG: hypothetical protein HY077_06260 [Elusimicrobia bacterium]|nr:hypothetical protein [Elusimicrobiota bacterium]
METFMAVCMGLITVELGIIVAAILMVALRVRDTAQAVEVVAYRVDSEIEGIGSTLRSGWLKTLGATASVVAGIWSGRRGRDE